MSIARSMSAEANPTRVDASVRQALTDLSLDLHAHPETAYNETRSAHILQTWLKSRGVSVQGGIAHLPTAFRADIGAQGKPSVFLIAEYDALPEIGHGCGHNLIAVSMLAAFEACRSAASTGTIAGVSLIGAPAEEDGGGKISLIRAGVFDGAYAVLSTHPASEATWSVGALNVGSVTKRVSFRGQSAHAASSPHLGVSALSATLSLFSGVDSWRLHLRDGARVHGIIVDGGHAANVIPSASEAVFTLRSADMQQLEMMEERFAEIATGAALMAATSVHIEDSSSTYAPMAPNATLTRLLERELAKSGILALRNQRVIASSDLGNVSRVAPTDWVRFPVSPDPIAGHSLEMRDASATEWAHENAFKAGEAIAAVTLQLIRDHTELP